MITVVSENYGSNNVYEGMSLAEACTQLQIDTNNILNETQMDILLAEHAFLYENGYEVEYFDEAGNETKASISMKDRIIAGWEKIKKSIMDTYDKLIMWIKVHVAELSENFSKIGLNKRNVDAAINAVFVGDQKPTTIPVDKMANKVDYASFKKGIETGFKKNGMEDFEKTNSIIFDHYVKATEEEDRLVDIDDMKSAASAIFNPDHMIKHIYELKKKANKEIDNLKNTLKKEKSDENLDEKIKNLNNAVRFNTIYARDAVKIHHAWIAECVAKLRALCSRAEAKEAIRGVKKDARRDKMNSMKPKNLMASHRTKADAKDTERRDNRAKKAQSALDAADKPVNASALYLGKYYNV